MAIDGSASPSRSAASWFLQSQPQSGEGGNVGRAQLTLFGATRDGPLLGARYRRDAGFGQWAVHAQTAREGTRLGAAVGGSLVWAAGAVFAGPRVDDSVIIVDTGAHADVPVYFENRYAGRTGVHGKLLVTGARGHQKHQVRIDTTALPIDAAVADDRQDVVAPAGGMAVARFEVTGPGETIGVRHADGAPLPPGALARIASQSSLSAVSSRSTLFVQHPGRGAEIEVEWAGHACRFAFEPGAGPPATLREFTCQ